MSHHDDGGTGGGRMLWPPIDSPPHHDERITVLIPSNMKVEFGLDEATRALAGRVLDLAEGKKQKEIEALQAEVTKLAAELSASTDDLDKTVKENPDPNPKD